MGGGKVKGAWGRIIPSHGVENGSIELESGRWDSPRGAVKELAQPSQATSPKQKLSRSAGKGGGASYSCKGPTRSQTAKAKGAHVGSVSRSLMFMF